MDGCNVIMNMRLPLQLQKGIYDFIHILQMLKVNIKVKGVILWSSGKGQARIGKG